MEVNKFINGSDSGRHLYLRQIVLAQQTDADLVADFKEAVNNFIESGQVYAFILGIILGYLVRKFTTYGG